MLTMAQWGYVHRGPVPNGSDPILERTISVHKVPFRLSSQATVGTGLLWFGTESKYPRLIALLVPKGTGPGVYMVTDPFGTKTVPKLDLLFWRSSFRTWSGTDWRYGEQVPCELKAYPSRFLDRNHLEPVSCEHSLGVLAVSAGTGIN